MYGLGVDVIRSAVGLPALKFFEPTAPSDNVVTSYGVVTTGKYTVTSTVSDTLKIGPGRNDFAANFAYEVSKHRCYEREMEGLVQRWHFK